MTTTIRKLVNVGRAIRLTALAAALLAGCGDPRGEAGGGNNAPVPPDGLGSISVELQLGANLQLASVAYHISRSGFDRTGSLDVSNSTTVSGVVTSLPAATGYAIALSASDVGGHLAGCQGSATFNVTAGAITPLPIHMTCHETVVTAPPPPAGVPIPPAVPAVLALALLALGARALRSRPDT